MPPGMVSPFAQGRSPSSDLLSACYVPGSVLGTGPAVVSKTHQPLLSQN